MAVTRSHSLQTLDGGKPRYLMAIAINVDQMLFLWMSVREWVFSCTAMTVEEEYTHAPFLCLFTLMQLSRYPESLSLTFTMSACEDVQWHWRSRSQESKTSGALEKWPGLYGVFPLPSLGSGSDFFRIRNEPKMQHLALNIGFKHLKWGVQVWCRYAKQILKLLLLLLS